jgi:hypothetical protein
MFIWFVYQDDPGQPWESGLYTAGGAAKNPSPSRFSSTARPVDMRNSVYSFRRGTANPLVTLAARKFCSNNAAGAMIEVSWRVVLNGREVDTGQQPAALRSDCTLPVRLGFTVARGGKYTAVVTIDGSGSPVTRTLTIRGT